MAEKNAISDVALLAAHVAAGAAVIDLRDEDEKYEGLCARALPVPWSTWTTADDGSGTKRPPSGAIGVPADTAAPIITHCRGGGRGGKAKVSLEAAGYTNVLNGGGPQKPEVWSMWAGAVGDDPATSTPRPPTPTPRRWNADAAEPEPEADVVPILKNGGGAPPSDLAGQRVVWNEGNLLQNEAERPEGGYMKIDEPDTPFEYQMKPVSDSESDEDEGSASSGGGPSPPPAAFVLDGDEFAAAFEAKRHTVVQGVDDADEATDAPAEPEPEPEPQPQPEPAVAPPVVEEAPSKLRPLAAADAAAVAAEPYNKEVTVTSVPEGGTPGESERFTAMEAAEAAKFKKERSAHCKYTQSTVAPLVCSSSDRMLAFADNEYEQMQEYKRKLAAGELADEDY